MGGVRVQVIVVRWEADNPVHRCFGASRRVWSAFGARTFLSTLWRFGASNAGSTLGDPSPEKKPDRRLADPALLAQTGEV
jgi:hypothetical protein